jgi:membrane-bound inhibitor of C-type lysozyme
MSELSRLDYFAKAAMQELLASGNESLFTGNGIEYSLVVTEAIKIAVATIDAIDTPVSELSRTDHFIMAALQGILASGNAYKDGTIYVDYRAVAEEAREAGEALFRAISKHNAEKRRKNY